MRWLVLAAWALAAPAAAVERVVDFHSAIRIQADGGVDITERIVVEAEGNLIRRGILRDFPTDYRDRFGNRVTVPFEVRQVLRNGAPETWATEGLSNGVRIRIGRGDRMLVPGAHVYEITYRTARVIGHFPDHDELYWNVNGNGWTFRFDHISAEVQLPKAVPARELRAEAYTGPQGSRGRDYQYMVRDGAVGFTSTAPFRAYEGMTIVVGFPKGIVAEPGLLRRAAWFLAANKGVAAGLAGFALMLAFFYWRWLHVGRDPKSGPRFPRYEAPKGLGPSAVRFIDRQGFDPRCFAAGLLGLGSRGFLKIRQSGGDFTLEPTGRTVEYLAGERALSTLAAAKRTLGREYDPAVALAQDALKSELRQLYEEKAFSRNHGSVATGVLIGAFSIAAMILLRAPLAIAFLIGFAIVATIALFYRWMPAYSVSGRRLQDEIDGLRQYLGVAERDELARSKAPPKTPQEFSRFLPYAVALDVEKTWADRFVIALGSAAMAQAVSDWYSSSSSDSGFSVSGLTNSVSSLGETVSAASSPPGSSSGFSDSGGGGGGGSSGGGGGGGGGSGW